MRPIPGPHRDRSHVGDTFFKKTGTDPLSHASGHHNQAAAFLHRPPGGKDTSPDPVFGVLANGAGIEYGNIGGAELSGPLESVLHQ
jgi:hypothetical protein